MPDDLSDEMLADRIRALLEERAIATNDPERIRLIDQELRRFGHDAAPPAKRAEKRPAARTARTTRTTSS